MTGHVLRNLEAGLVPADQLAWRRWYYASRNWYYHEPGVSQPAKHPGPEFYRLVDPDLRELCHWLHQQSCWTTPSCQGHFHSPQWVQQVWNELTGQAALVRRVGLIVHACDDQQLHLFQNSNFWLPWASRQEFAAAVQQLQGSGYLGFWLRPKNQGELLHRVRIDPPTLPGLTLKVESPDAPGELAGLLLVHVTVQTDSPEEQSRTWRAIREHLQQSDASRRRRAA